MLQQSLSPAQRRDATSIDARVTTSMPLVRRIAWHVHARVASAIDVEDLIQIGMIALVEAARTYEDRGHAFATYASVRIRGEMIDHLRREARMARSAMQKRRAIAASRARLEQKLRRAPCDAEMAADMGVTPAMFQAMVTAIQPLQDASIDEVYSDHLMVFADTADSAEDRVSRDQLAIALKGAIDHLNTREQTILQLYFVEELNLDEIGMVLGIGAARVCQIKKQALTKMRGLMDADAHR
jgi:RNA polymerase sigma factor for flagellar operon FliA